MSNILQPEGNHQLKETAALLDVANQQTLIQPATLPDVASQQTSVIETVKPLEKKQRRLRRRVVVALCIGLVLLPLCISGLTLYFQYSAQYHHDLALAQGGVKHLQNAEQLLKKFTQGSFDAPTATQSRQEFSSAFIDFTQLKSGLEQLPGIATGVPKYGGLLSSALRIVPLAIELSQAGMIGSDALNIVQPHLHGILDTRQPGITAQNLTAIAQDVTQVQALLNTATMQINHLQPADLQIDSRIGPELAKFPTSLPQIQTDFQTIQKFLRALLL